MNNTRYHRFRIERDAPTQELYGSIVVGIPNGVGDFDTGSISTTEERTVRRCLSIPDGVPFTMLQHTIDPDRRDYEGKAATFSRPDETLVCWNFGRCGNSGTGRVPRKNAFRRVSRIRLRTGMCLHAEGAPLGRFVPSCTRKAGLSRKNLRHYSESRLLG